MRRSCVYICATLFLTVSGSVQAASNSDQVEFNFKYRPGSSYTQKISSRQVGAVKLPSPMPEQKMSQSMEQTVTSRCVSVNADGSGEFESTIDTIAVRMTFGSLNVTFDSRTYDPNAKTDLMNGLVSKIFNAMSGMQFGMTLSPTGQVLKVHGFDNALKKLRDSVGIDGKEAQPLKAMFDQIGKSMDDNSMAQELQSFSRMVPAKPGAYKVGDKWDRNWKANIFAMSLDGRGEYELVGIETFRGHPCAKIRTKETFSVASAPDTPTTNPFAAMLAKMDIKMSSNGGGGYAYIDIESGVLVHMVGTQNLNMSFQVKNDDKARSGKPEKVTQFSQTMRMSTAADLVEPGAVDTGTASSQRLPGAATKPESDR